MADPNLTAEEKTKMLARIDQTKLEKHTPKDEVKKTAKEIRDIEIANTFALANDSLFGLVPVEGAPNEYVFGIINLLNDLQMLRDNVDPQEHHRVVFDTEKDVIEVMQIWLKDIAEVPK